MEEMGRRQEGEEREIFLKKIHMINDCKTYITKVVMIMVPA